MTVQLRVGLIGETVGRGPVVILLHGFGAPGDDLAPLASVITAPEGTRWVIPEAPIELDFGGRAWWMLDLAAREAALARGEERNLSRELPPGLPQARAAILSLIANIEHDLHVPASQIVLVGFSQGGMLAMDVMLHAPAPLAGVAVLSGTLIAEDTWLARMPARKDVPVLLSHGHSDPLLPFKQSERLRDLLCAAGFAVQWVPFADGHTIPEEVIEQLGVFVQGALTR
jgi:phospholipase/carboxylesterase